jgi:transcription initiation factor TFIID TATA-box-binding protein
VSKITPSVEIVNIVLSVVFNQQFDLEKISDTKTLNTLYNPDQFPALIYKLKEKNEIKFLSFASGKMVCAGAKSQNEAELAIQRFVKTFHQAGIQITDPAHVTPENAVG